MRSFDLAARNTETRRIMAEHRAKLEACAVAICRTCNRVSFVEDEAKYQQEHAGHDYQVSK